MNKYITSNNPPADVPAPTPPSANTPVKEQVGTNFTSRDCGKVNGMASGPPLMPGPGLLAINDSSDLSSCIVGNSNGKVFQVKLDKSDGQYDYIIWVLAQGPKGVGSGSIELQFSDETGDHYHLAITSSSVKWHYVRYNSDRPGINVLNWNAS
jgi:hypothetical protein